jgi:hypothetical protein
MHRAAAKVLGIASGLTLGAVYALGATPTARATIRPAAAVAADSVTGCLQKGDKADQYTVMSKDGKKYTVWSKSVKLAGHVGHTVTVAGNAAASDPMKMSVSKLSMVSASCG